MKGPTLIGAVLIAVAFLDLLVGLTIVVPRAQESARPVLRAAFAGGAVLMILLGGAFLSGLLGTRA